MYVILILIPQAFILCAVLAVARAGVLLNTGASTVHRAEDGLGNYAFGYTEGHATGGTFRQESGSHGVKIGSYGLIDADGRQRIVNYVADAAGFRADIKTNEPGVDPAQDPAATTINKGLVVAAPAAPIAVAAAAPVAAIAPAIAAAPAVVAGPLHYGAGHIAAPLHYGAAHIAAPLHYGAAHIAAPLGGAFSYSSAVNHPGLALAGPAIVKSW